MATLEERLTEYEELFVDRYTEKDECYQTHVTTPVKLPPVITDWNTNNYDRRRDNRGQGGRDGRGWDFRHGGDRDRRDNRYDKRDNRGYGGGRQDYRDRGPRDNRYQTEYKSSDFYEMYY